MNPPANQLVVYRRLINPINFQGLTGQSFRRLTLLSQLGLTQITCGKPNGKGVGLTHAFRVVSAWGGHVTIDSIVGHGATVRIILPKIQEGAAAGDSSQVGEISKTVEKN